MRPSSVVPITSILQEISEKKLSFRLRGISLIFARRPSHMVKRESGRPKGHFVSHPHQVDLESKETEIFWWWRVIHPKIATFHHTFYKHSKCVFSNKDIKRSARDGCHDTNLPDLPVSSSKRSPNFVNVDLRNSRRKGFVRVIRRFDGVFRDGTRRYIGHSRILQENFMVIYLGLDLAWTKGSEMVCPLLFGDGDFSHCGENTRVQ